MEAGGLLKNDMPVGALLPADAGRISDTACASLRAAAEPGNQARLLNASGFEIVRVELQNVSQTSVQGGKRSLCSTKTLPELQDKQNRAYYVDALTLAPGELYVSELDANVENGEVEFPIRPMLRAAERFVNATSSETMA